MSQRHSNVSVQVRAGEECQFQEILERVATKWSVQIILATATGPVRFTELESSIDGISRRMLTLTLRRLERDGLITRTVYPCVPPKVEYTATESALELREAFQSLAEWALRHRQTIAEARREYDSVQAASTV